MNGLKKTFEGEVDFFDFDIDDDRLEGLRAQNGIIRQGQYILMAPDGETVLQRWFGPLPSTVDEQITAVLEDHGY